MSLGPIQAIKRRFGFVYSDNDGGVLQAAVAVHIKGKGSKRITHITAVIGDTNGVATTLKAKIIVFSGGINKDEATDTVSAFHLLKSTDGDQLYETGGGPATGVSYYRDIIFTNEDILEVADGEDLSIVLIARSDGPVFLRLFVNGCITTQE